ncbi:MAG: M20/M25/M40 family metallo-hydrolase [Acidobacteria bacterium]|nr:M20/M25/M40 family metallo-hydrolase [Acidobacteriota bacterium]
MAAIFTTSPKELDLLAASRGVKEALLQLSRDKQWVNEKHLELCRVPSPTFQEQRRAEWMLAAFKSLGCEARIDQAGNVIAFLDGNAHAPLVAFTAHLDTVLAPRNSDEIRTEPDGTFTGPGVSDNGAGLAGLLALVRALKSAPPLEGLTASPVFIANVGEEGDGNLCGMRYLCTDSPLASKIRAFVVLDGPAVEHVTCEALACRRYEVIITGAGGHSWIDYGVANPVHAMARMITIFAENLPQTTPDKKLSFNFGLIEGGVSVNAIPTSARTRLDLRSVDEAVLERMSIILEAALTRACEWENEKATARVAGKIRETGSRPGGKLASDSPLLANIRKIDAYLGIRSVNDCGSTDANIPLSCGIPAISIGAGGAGGGAHTPAEWYKPEGRDTGLKRLLLLLALSLTE